MRKIIDYHVIRCSSRERLQMDFMTYVELGFEPLGVLVIERGKFTRVFSREMIKYAPSGVTFYGEDSKIVEEK